MAVVINGTTGVSGVDGSAGTPSYQGTDSNTGIFFPAADTIAFGEGGVESMRIDSSGNVGIGTSSPGRKLQVSNTAADPFISIIGAANNEGGLLFGDNASDAVGQIRYMHNGDYMYFNTNGSERMRINSSGQVGIGTNNPTDRLTVSDGTTNVAVNPTGGIFYFGPTTNHPTVFITNNSERARITSGGDLLVGTTTANGRISIETGNDECIWMKNTWGANGATFVLWNNAGSGDNYFQGFFVDAAGNLVGSIDYNRGAGLTRYNTTSDATLKNIIGDADSQLSIDILNTTRVREFAWKNDPTQKPQVGVIAQELYETYKGAVSVGGDFERERDVTEEVEEEYTDEEGNPQTRTVTKVVGKETYTEYRPWGVDKTAFTFHLIAGWQAHEKLLKEAMTRIEALEAEVAALKGAN